jgi:hypothetical protein
VQASTSYFHYKSPPPDYNKGHTLRFDEMIKTFRCSYGLTMVSVERLKEKNQLNSTKKKTKNNGVAGVSPHVVLPRSHGTRPLLTRCSYHPHSPINRLPCLSIMQPGKKKRGDPEPSKATPCARSKSVMTWASALNHTMPPPDNTHSSTPIPYTRTQRPLHQGMKAI